MEKISFKKAGTYYLIGNLFNKGIAFLTIPVFTRILSKSEYGIVNTYNSWISILTIVMGFAIYMGIRAAFVDYKEEIDDFMSVSTTFTLLCGAVITVMVGGVALFLPLNISVSVVFLCLMQGVAAALLQNYSMYLMMKYSYKLRTMFMILPNLISVVISILVILFVLKSNLYMGRIVPTACVTIGFALITVVMVYRKSRKLFNKKMLKYALAISAPLVLHGIALTLLSQSDRMMITWLADSAQTGIYSLIYNFSMIATVITTSLDGIWVPWFTDKLKNRETQAINTKVVGYINLMTYAMIGIILIGPEVVKLLASKGYWEGISIIPPIVLSNFIIFAYTLYVNIEHFHKKTLVITINTLIAAGANLILNLIFIPLFGYVAAAYTTLVSYIISFALHAIRAKKLEKELYTLKTFAPSLIHLTLATVVFYVCMDMWYIRIPVLVIYIILMFYKNRDLIKNVLRRKS